MRFKSDFLVLLLLIFVLGFLYLIIEGNVIFNCDLNVDERLWIKRSYNYINSVKDLNFVEGIQTVHPGITVMASSGIFIHLADYFWGGDFNNLYATELYKFAFNIPIVLLIAVFFFFFYYILKKLKFSRNLAFLVLIILSTNPSYIFNSTPVDKFSAIFILLSLSFLLIYANTKFNCKKYLFLSSFFAGFGVLSKLSALILIPFSLFVLLYFAPLNHRRYKGAFKDFVLYLFFFFTTVVFIFPGFIISPIESISAISGARNSVLVSGLGQSSEVYSLAEKTIFYLSSIINSGFTLVAFSLFLFFLIFVAKKLFYRGIKSDFSEKNLFHKNILVLFVFCFVYFFYTIIFTNFLFYRYMLPSFLILNIGAAIGLYKIIFWYKSRYKIKESIGIITTKFVAILYIFQFLYLAIVYFVIHYNILRHLGN